MNVYPVLWQTPWDTLFFSSPFFLLAAVPFAALLAWQVWGRKKQDTISTSELSYIHVRLKNGVRPRVRAALLGTCALLVVLLLAEPHLVSEIPIPLSVEQRLSKQYIVLLDVSGSMETLMHDDTSVQGLVGKSRYDVAKEVFRAFVQEQKDERIGLALFTGVPFIVVHPTRDTALLERGVLDERFKFPHENADQQDDIAIQVEQWMSQIYFYSSYSGAGTDTPKALRWAESFIDRSSSYQGGRAFVVITDIDDRLDEIADAIHDLRNKDARVYFVGIDATNTPALQQQFVDDPYVGIFSSHTSQELYVAFEKIIQQERIVDEFSPRQWLYESDLRPYLAVLFLALFTVLCVLSETALLIMRGDRIRRTLHIMRAVRAFTKTIGSVKKEEQ